MDALSRCLALPVFVLTPLAIHAVPAQDNPTRTQTIALSEGWNAIFLEVEPADTEPAAVFAGTPIDIAAAHFPRGASAQFVTDPGIDLFQRPDWGVWYVESRPDAFLKTLHAIHGQRAYLVHSTKADSWNITGEVIAAEFRWQPDAFNLTGFAVDATAPPTFAQFLGSSRAHQHNRIYRLVDSTWRRVTSPGAQSMRSGEAFWIFCEGASTYQGPLRVKTRTHSGLLLVSGADEILLSSEADHPVAPTIEHVVSGGDPVPLSYLVQAINGPYAPLRTVAVALPDGAWSEELAPIEPGRAISVPFEVRRESMRSPVHSSLLKISTDVGTVCWVPVKATRTDLLDR